MKITGIEYKALFNLGNYENETIGLRAKLEENETPEAATAKLRDRAVSMAHPNVQKSLDQRRELLSEIKNLELKLEKKQQEWNEVADFLKAQGIKPDVASFPAFNKLLSPAVEVVEIEEIPFEEGDDDDDHNDGF